MQDIQRGQYCHSEIHNSKTGTDEMKDLKIYILLVLCTIVSACEIIENPNDFKAREVKLFAGMGVHLTASNQTKGDGVITQTTDTELGIGVIRLDEKTDGNNTPNYPYFISCPEPLTATVSLPDPEEGNLRTVTGFSTAQFFKNSSDEITYAAWYPWPKENTPEDGFEYNTNGNGTTVTFPIPSAGDSDIMYAIPVNGTMNTGFDVMEFKHALSLFRIYAYNSANLEWGKITSVTLNRMPDVCTITLPKSEEEDYDIAYSISEGDGIEMEFQSVPGTDIPTGFENKVFLEEWIAAPAELDAEIANKSGEIKVLDITVTTEGGNQGTIGTHNISIARNFKPGYEYDIVLRFSDNGIINADVKILDWIENNGNITTDVNVSGTFYNLSANGTANCYIVSSANFGYTFDATVKGNGSSAAMSGSRLDPTLNPETVRVIWSDNSDIWSEGNQNNLFRLETDKIVEGKVLFKLVGKNNTNDKSLTQEGNILLGVYDEAGKCLWTWHIWITDKPQKQNYTKGYIALDRNLGAIAPAPENSSSDNMKGLFYQWGRPTPFRLNKSTKTVEATRSYTRVHPDVAVADPLTLYGRYEFNYTNDAAGDAAASGAGNYHDWVDRGLFLYVNNLWGYREEEHEQPIKTMYDPCPQGYHVPYARNWENIENFWVNNNGGWPNEGIKLEIEGTEIWYPYQGFINIQGEYKPGHIHLHNGNAAYSDSTIVEVWSALINRHDDEDDPNSSREEQKINDSPYRFMFNRDENAKLSDEYTNRSRGLAVRCVSNNTADVVKDLSASQTANCYMIHEDGYYKFKATVRGNGVGSLLPLGGTTTAEINGGLSTTISPYKVDILWWQGDFAKGEEDFPDNKISDGKYEQYTPPENMCLHLLDNGILSNDGYVAFQITGFQKGNVVLAAYDDYGTILWTWHIWLTDPIADKISGNYTKMDRFLGVTFAPQIPGNISQISWNTGERDATVGFYYQWGRKDPIIGPPGITNGYSNALGNDNATTSDDTVASAGWWEKDGTKWIYRKTIDVKDKAAIPEVVKDPTAFYRSTTTNSESSSQWFPESFADGYTNVAMWGYAVADYSIEGQTFSKTMHDPCPPGYRTPFHFSWRYDSNYKYAEGDKGEETTNLTNRETGYDNFGIVTDKDHFEKMWFPFAGYRDPLTGGYTDVGTYGYMNTGMPMQQYNTRSFWYNKTQTGQYAGRHGSAYGKMVRCMKE